MAAPACAASCTPVRAPPCPQQPAAAARRRCRHSARRQAAPRWGAGACAALPRVTLYDSYDRLVPYEEAWARQKQLVDEVAASASAGRSSSASSSASSASSSASSAGDSPLGALLLLQHPPVYTLGAGATEGHLRFDPSSPPHPLYRTERGGEVTYHGPGQLVMYPILDLRRAPLQADLHWYLRSLEEVVIRALDSVSGLPGERIPGLTGVWVGGRKVAALGVRASRWVTYHGLALNVAPDLSPFGHIVPCGIADRQVASVQGLLADAAGAADATAGAGAWADDPLAAGFEAAAAAPPPAPASLLAGVAAALQEEQQRQAGGGEPPAAPAAVPAGAAAAASQLSADQLVEEYRHGLLEAFEEVFGVQLLQAPADVEAAAGAAALED